MGRKLQSADLCAVLLQRPAGSGVFTVSVTVLEANDVNITLNKRLPRYFSAISDRPLFLMPAPQADADIHEVTLMFAKVVRSVLLPEGTIYCSVEAFMVEAAAILILIHSMPAAEHTTSTTFDDGVKGTRYQSGCCSFNNVGNASSIKFPP
jgi:hypothetical protein